MPLSGMAPSKHGLLRLAAFMSVSLSMPSVQITMETARSQLILYQVGERTVVANQC